MAVSTRKHGYKKKQRALKKVETKKIEFEVIEVTEAKNLPKNYMVVPEEGIEKIIESKREKLLKRGLKVIEPIKIYKLRRIVEMVDFCVPLEKIE